MLHRHYRRRVASLARGAQRSYATPSHTTTSVPSTASSERADAARPAGSHRSSLAVVLRRTAGRHAAPPDSTRRGRTGRSRAWRLGDERRRSTGSRASHRVAVTVLVIALLLPATRPATAAPSCWEPPVAAPVSDPFRRPPCKWCPGNRGVEFDTGVGEPVRAVAAGTVTFAGPVAGTWFVVVRHRNGLRTTYGNVTDLTVSAGSTVVRGMRIATTAGRLHFGVREGDEYLDPTPFLGEWVGRARLIPIDGTPPRPAPPPRLSCVSA